MIEDTPKSRLASLQRKFRLLSEGRRTTVTRIHADRYRTEVFDGRRVGAAFDTFLGFLRRDLTREDLWVAGLVRHPTATQSELEIAAAASADVIRDEKRIPGVAAGRYDGAVDARAARPKKKVQDRAIRFAAWATTDLCPLMPLSGHRNRVGECPL